jgi:hypothetical protein
VALPERDRLRVLDPVDRHARPALGLPERVPERRDRLHRRLVRHGLALDRYDPPGLGADFLGLGTVAADGAGYVYI